MIPHHPQSAPEHVFPVGTPVCITEKIRRRDRTTETRTCGTIDVWEELPTGSWFSHRKRDRLWLRRLKLRKVDGEISLLVVDDATSIARIEDIREE